MAEEGSTGPWQTPVWVLQWLVKVESALASPYGVIAKFALLFLGGCACGFFFFFITLAGTWYSGYSQSWLLDIPNSLANLAIWIKFKHGEEGKSTDRR